MLDFSLPDLCRIWRGFSELSEAGTPTFPWVGMGSLFLDFLSLGLHFLKLGMGSLFFELVTFSEGLGES